VKEVAACITVNETGRERKTVFLIIGGKKIKMIKITDWSERKV